MTTGVGKFCPKVKIFSLSSQSEVTGLGAPWRYQVLCTVCSDSAKRPTAHPAVASICIVALGVQNRDPSQVQLPSLERFPSPDMVGGPWKDHPPWLKRSSTGTRICCHSLTGTRVVCQSRIKSRCKSRSRQFHGKSLPVSSWLD